MTPTHFPATPQWLWFAYPWAFALLLLLPVTWWLWTRRARRAVIRFSGLEAVRAAGGILPRRIRLILPILRVAALLCLIVAAARPQKPDESVQLFTEGVAIQMVVDTSTSMAELDMSPSRNQPKNRLEVVKEVFRRFVNGGDDDLLGRKNDLVGMIRFARYADSVCPPTLDHEALLDVLKSIDLVSSVNEDGTAIGDGLGLAVERLRDIGRESAQGETMKIVSRVVILLTDGENNAGLLTPEQAGDLAATQGIKVYTILAGSGRRLGFGMRVETDDSQLRYIAEATGGRHFRADDPESLEQVYAEIDKLERTKIEEKSNLRWGELSGPWLVAAFACLCVQMFLGSTWLRKTP